jgi:hypothetical protein
MHLRERLHQQRVVFLEREPPDVRNYRRTRLNPVCLSPLGARVRVGRVLIGRNAVGNQRWVGVAVHALDARPHLFGDRHGNYPTHAIPKRHLSHPRADPHPHLARRKVMHGMHPRGRAVAQHQRVGVVQCQQVCVHHYGAVLPKQCVEFAQYRETHRVALPQKVEGDAQPLHARLQMRADRVAQTNAHGRKPLAVYILQQMRHQPLRPSGARGKQ